MASSYGDPESDFPPPSSCQMDYFLVNNSLKVNSQFLNIDFKVDLLCISSVRIFERPGRERAQGNDKKRKLSAK